MNAFDVPHLTSFAVSAVHLDWVKCELQTASDLKSGGAELMEFIRKLDVSLVDMGHTHHNEIANVGRTVYSATRSIGQTEKWPIGYSVINMDCDVVSWRFVEPGKLPAVERAERDQDNSLGAWPEHRLLGIQPGPNKNGNKW
jgi:hypothetical protein